MTTKTIALCHALDQLASDHSLADLFHALASVCEHRADCLEPPDRDQWKVAKLEHFGKRLRRLAEQCDFYQLEDASP